MLSTIIVHSHELNEHGEPKQEYRVRLERVIEMTQEIKGATYIVLTGGKATKGIDLRQGDAGKTFLLKNGLDEGSIRCELDPTGSLEAVGEAMYARRDHGDLLVRSNEIVIMSSDYHKNRIKHIQQLILGDTFKKSRFEGISREVHGNFVRTMEQEDASLEAFAKTFTFAGISVPIRPADPTMWSAHPLYGKIREIEEQLWKVHPLYKSHPSNPYS